MTLSKRITLLFSFLLLSTLAFSAMSFVPKQLPTSQKPTDFIWSDLISKVIEEKQEGSKGDELTLGDLIDIAITRNPSLREAWSTAKANYYTYLQNKGLYFPELSISAEAERKHNPISYDSTGASFRKEDVRSIRPQATLSYLLYDFGARKGTVDAAYQAMASKDWLYKWQIQTVLKKVILSYYDYLNALASLDAFQADLQDAKTSYQAAEERQKVGVGTIADVLQAKSNYAKQQMQVVTQQGVYKSALGTLNVSIGLPANSQFKVAPPNTEIQAAKVLNELEQLISMAKETRADIHSEKASVLQKQAEVKNTKGQLFPSITASFSIGETYFHERFVQDGTKGIDWTAEIQLNFTLFKGGYNYNQYRASKQALLVERYNLKDSIETLEYDVLNDYYNLHSAKKNFSYSKDYLDASQENYKVALANYQAGTGSILDLLTAQSSLAEARDSRVEATTKVYTSLVNLAYSVGLLWLPDAEGRIDTLMNLNPNLP